MATIVAEQGWRMRTSPPRGGPGEIREFVASHRGLTLDEFRARQPESFLLLEAEEPDTHADTTALTVRLDDSRGPAAPAVAARPARASEAVVPEMLLPIVHRDDDGVVGRITVGRASGNDIVLRFPQVSKIHAYFIAPAPGAGLLLVDCGSTNGTRVNGVRIREGDRVELLDGDRIDFGGTPPFAYFTPEGMYRYLPLLARRLGLPPAA